MGSEDHKVHATVGEVRYTTDGRLARGTLTLLQRDWPIVDFRDKLEIDEELRRALHLPANRDEEERQCLVLQGAAAALAKNRTEPTVDAVQALARSWRKGLLRDAQSASRAMGPSQARVPRVQGDLMMFAHDSEHADHEKDYRTYVAFPQ